MKIRGFLHESAGVWVHFVSWEPHHELMHQESPYHFIFAVYKVEGLWFYGSQKEIKSFLGIILFWDFFFYFQVIFFKSSKKQISNLESKLRKLHFGLCIYHSFRPMSIYFRVHICNLQFSALQIAKYSRFSNAFGHCSANNLSL